MKKNMALMFILLLFTVACGKGYHVYDVYTDYDDVVDFSALKTYGLLPLPTKSRLDRLTAKRIKRSIEKKLAEKGFELSSENPDFIVAATSGEKQVSYKLRHTQRTYPYEEGRISIDLLNPKNQMLLWHGSARADLGKRVTPEILDNAVSLAIDKVFENFPPRDK